MSFFRRLFSTRKHPYIPGRHKTETLSVNLSGSLLTLQLPAHTPFDSLDKDKKPPAVVDLFNDNNFTDVDIGQPEWQLRGESGLGLMRRTLGFLAPPWHQSDRYGRMSFGMGIGRMEIMPQEMSLFNPAHLEQVVIRNTYFSGPMQPTRRHVEGPVDWRAKEGPAGTWLYYELHDIHDETHIRTSITLPLSHRHSLSLGISCFGYQPMHLFYKYFEDIKGAALNSITLELSERAQRELDQAKQRWPEAKASPARLPEDWVYPKYRRGDRSKGEPRIVILKPGTPPPPFKP